MNFTKRFTLSLALTALAGLSASAATTVTKATFTLPATAYWNDTMLPAGDYTLSVGRNLTGVPVVHIQGEGVDATFFAPANVPDAKGVSQLKLDEVDGTYVVRELDSASTGMAFRFGVAKHVREMISQGENRQVTVPMAAAAGQ